MPLIKSIKNFFTSEEIPEYNDVSEADEQIEEDRDDVDEEFTDKRNRKFYQSLVSDDAEFSNLIKKPRNSERILHYRPYSLNDMECVVDALKMGKTVVLYVDVIEHSLAQSVLDFTSGVVCALGCTCTKATNFIYVIIPDRNERNYDV